MRVDPSAMGASKRRPPVSPSRQEFSSQTTSSIRVGTGIPAKPQDPPVSETPDADALNTIGATLAQQGDHVQAITFYFRAIHARPNFREALNNLGIALGVLGQLEESIDAFQRALRIDPNSHEVHNNLGVPLVKVKRLDEAVTHFEAALKLQPGFAEAHHNLGIAYRNLDRLEEAVECYRKAITLKPDYAEAYVNLGNVLSQNEQHEDAALCYRSATRIKPDYADAHNYLGLSLAKIDRDVEAEACYRRSLEIKPDNHEALNNYGLLLASWGRYEEALGYYDEAIRVLPGYADSRLNRGLTLLAFGRFEEGWPEYEWRWHCNKSKPPEYDAPRWDGGPIAGQTILLHAEQGLGDTLQFIRFAELVKNRGATVVFECQPALIPLISRCRGIDTLVAKGDPLPEYHTQCALLSLPNALGISLQGLPARIPYLHTDPELIEPWRRELESVDGFRIGILWQGSPHYKRDRRRSYPLRHFSHLSRIEGVQLFSLQKNLGIEQIADFERSHRLIDLGPRIDNEHGAFMDTAAILQSLDLVISPDTALAHLAGALGVPVWIPTSTHSDWRWMFEREDSPWYPSVRLFRQETLDDWDPVFRRMAREVEAQLGKPESTAPVSIPMSPGELADKITILGLKFAKFDDPAKLRNVRAELDALRLAYTRAIPEEAEDIGEIRQELAEVNAQLWDVEENIRACDRAGDFGPRFVELARSVYRQNDRRAELKRLINQRLGSRWLEEKSYGT
ncbi:tetratricopeptide repeat protein [Singulisphaera rosea]